mgnify:CR=1 FL=1
MNVFFVVFGLYLCSIFLKQALRHKGEIRSVFLALALFLLPPFIAASVIYEGNVLGAFDKSLPANQDPANWWVVPITPEKGEPWHLNVLATLITVSLLYVGVTVFLWLVSSVFLKRRGIELLSMHRAVIKWFLVIAGAVVLLRINLWPVLLGMGAASIVLGFALKEMLENLFTGMALDSEGAFHSGDWIQVGENGPIGRVYEKNWRSTKLITLKDESITVPNRLLGGEKILCFNKPDPLFARTLRVGTSYNDPPVKVKEILRDILIREPGVAKSPPPRVRTIEYGDFAITYEMKFWISDYRRHQEINDSIMTQVWYAFKFYDIQIPFPIRTVHLKEQDQLTKEEAKIQDELATKLSFLAGLDFFKRHMTLRDLDLLARNSFRRHYVSGEPIIQRGEIGDALYLVMEGTCEVVLPDGQRRQIRPGQYFGEIGLLGASARTADVVAGKEGSAVLRVDKYCMDVLFGRYPDLLGEFEQIRNARKQELPAEEEPAIAPAPHPLLRAARCIADFLRPW